MHAILTYVLVIIASIAILMVFVFYRNREDENFVRLSVLFIFVFFMIPFYMVIFTNGFFYGQRLVDFEHPGVLRAAFAICVFLISFFATDMRRLFTRKESPSRAAVPPSDRDREGSLTVDRVGVFLILALGLAFYSLYRYIAPDSVELYDVRRGMDDGSHSLFFLSITSTTLMLSAFFLCIRAKWRLFALLCISLILIGHLLSSPGRTTLALSLVLAFIFVSGIRPRVFISLLPIVAVFLSPVIINGKEVIYQLIVNSDPSYIVSSYNPYALDGSIVFKNLAHPFVSVVFAADMIESSGYRYFYDYLHGFLFYGRAVGWDFGDSLTYFNTLSILGVKSSIIPPGYVAFGYLQLSYIGVIVSGVFYRLTFHLFSNTSLYRIAPSKEMSFYSSFVCANTFYTGDVRQLVISFVLVVLVMHVAGKVATRRVKYVRRGLSSVPPWGDRSGIRFQAEGVRS